MPKKKSKKDEPGGPLLPGGVTIQEKGEVVSTSVDREIVVSAANDRPLGKGAERPRISIDVAAIERKASLVKLLYNLRPAQDGEEEELAEALADPSFCALAEGLAKNTVFARALIKDRAESDMSSGLLVEGSGDVKSRFVFVQSTGELQKAISNSILLEPLRVVDQDKAIDAAGVNLMRPMKFAAFGRDLPLVEDGVFEEVVILLQRGDVEVKVGEKVFSASAVRPAQDVDPAFVCLAFCTEDGKRLPRIRINAVANQATGIFIGHARPMADKVLPWRLSGNRIVAIETGDVGKSIVDRIETIPTGREAIIWARRAERMFSGNDSEGYHYPHDEAHKLQHLSPRNPWHDGWPLRHIEARVLLVPSNLAGPRRFLAKHEQEDELMVALAGTTICSFAEDEALGAMHEMPLDEIQQNLPGLVPHMLALSSRRLDGKVVNPPAAFFDASMPHGVSAGGMEDAVCIHFVYSRFGNVWNRRARPVSVDTSRTDFPLAGNGTKG